MVNNSLTDKVSVYRKQIRFLNNEIRAQTHRNDNLDEIIGSLQIEIENQNTTNAFLHKNNSELDEIIHDLRSQRSKTGFDSSFDLLKESMSDTASNVIPGNLAEDSVTSKDKHNVSIFEQEKSTTLLQLQLSGREKLAATLEDEHGVFAELDESNQFHCLKNTETTDFLEPSPMLVNTEIHQAIDESTTKDQTINAFHKDNVVFALHLDVKATVEQNKDSNEYYQMVICDLKKRLDATEHRFENLKSELDDEKAVSQNFQSEVQREMAEYSSLEGQYATLNDEMAEQKRINMVISKEKAMISEKLDFEVSTNKSRLEEILQFEENIVAIRSNAAHDKKTLQEKLEKVQSELAAFKHKYSYLDKNMTELKNEHSLLQKYADQQQDRQKEFDKMGHCH